MLYDSFGGPLQLGVVLVIIINDFCLSVKFKKSLIKWILKQNKNRALFYGTQHVFIRMLTIGE